MHDAKPCPFCGSKPEWRHHPKGYTPFYPDRTLKVTEWQSSILCPDCKLPHCSGFGTVKWEGGNALAQQYAMKRALQQWNRRAVTDGVTGMDAQTFSQEVLPK